MTDAELDEIRRRAEAATPWPWRPRPAPRDSISQEQLGGHSLGAGAETWHNNAGNFHPEDARYVVDEFEILGLACPDYDVFVPIIERDADALFIYHAREDVPALLAEVERLKIDSVELDRLGSVVREARDLAGGADLLSGVRRLLSEEEAADKEIVRLRAAFERLSKKCERLRAVAVAVAAAHGPMHHRPAPPTIIGFEEPSDSPVYSDPDYDPTKHADDCPGCAFDAALSALEPSDLEPSH